MAKFGLILSYSCSRILRVNQSTELPCVCFSKNSLSTLKKRSGLHIYINASVVVVNAAIVGLAPGLVVKTSGM
jgi:hypothetical protein